MQTLHIKLKLIKLRRTMRRIARIRRVRLQKLTKKISTFLFFKKITLARWQLNTFSVMMLSLGFILGTYAMVMELVPRLMALDETSYTVEQAGDSELTSGSGTGVDISAIAVTLGKDDNWFNMGWNLKKQLTVKNLSAVTLPANSPIQVTVNTKELFDASNLQNDCDDLRIVHYTGTGAHTELTRSFYKANGATDCSNSTATIVTFPIQAEMATGASSGNYYMYYKNSGASNPGFGDNGYNIGSAQATMVCPFNGTTTCVDGETPTTATGAIRYGTGSALSFDGFDDKVNSSSGIDFNTVDEITISAWIKRNSNAGRYVIFNNGHGISFESENSVLTARVRGNSLANPTYRWSIASGGVIDTNWHHVAYTYKRGVSYALFLDGVKVAENTEGIIESGSSAEYIGNSNPSFGNFPFNGHIDDIQLSNNIKYTQNFTPLTGPALSDANTKLLYHFDENGEDPRNAGKAIDASGNGNHGTITGAKYVGGLVGVDPSTSSGQVKGQSYAGHEGIFLEEATTNLITNPSFEHTTYNTNWGLNYFNYNNTLDTYTPSLAKRNSAGPFAAGVLSQDDYGDLSNLSSDQISFSHGTTIKDDFSVSSDDDQGSLVFWWTPEFSSTSLNSGSTMFIEFRSSSNLTYNWVDDKFYLGGYPLGTYEVSAGNTYLIVLRWDKDNFITNNFANLSINDVLIGDNTTAYTNWEDDWGDTNLWAFDGIVEGMTIYRRPLYDGTYGINVGNGDEIEQIYNSGTGKDPTLVTGSWDVVFALPTNSTAGSLTTGTGNSWSHPHLSNLLYSSTTNTGGFMMNGTYTADGWADEGTPSTVTALATGEKVYAGGYKTTSDAANEGIYYEKTIVAGNDWVVRGLGHSDGTCVPKIILYNQTGTAEIGSLTGTTTSTRTSPNIFLFTGEAPAGMTTLRVKLVNTAISGTCYWHQVEVLSNSISNPSMEMGTGDPWVPTWWSNGGYSAGEASQDTITRNSGSSSLHVQESSGLTYMRSSTLSLTNGRFYSVGSWTSGTTGRGLQGNGGCGSGYMYQQHTASTIANTQTSSGEGYEFLNFRFQGTGCPVWDIYASAGQSYSIDDVYMLAMSDVSLTVNPANESNSTEASGLRVDGNDDLTQPISLTGVTTTAGIFKFKITPRHNYNVANLFGSANPHIFSAWYDSLNYIRLYFANSTTAQMSAMFSGNSYFCNWNSPTLNAGTTYSMEISYLTGGKIMLLVDGVEKINCDLTHSMTNAPNIATFGGASGGNPRYDATFSNFMALTPSENTSSPYYKFGSKSVKLVNSGTIPDEYTIALDPNATSTHTLSAYVYDGTTGNIGGTVSSSIAKLVFGGNIVTPASYTDMGGGWWRLSYSAATIDASLPYGVQALAGKTIYVDGVQLEAKAYATTYGDGNLGTGYSWSGTEHESTSTRMASNLIYTNNSDLTANNGTVSFWTRPNSWSYGGLIYRTYVSFGNFTLHYQQGTAPGNNNYWGLRINNNSPWATKALDFTNDKWVHVVATWNNGTSKVYANGVGGTAQAYTGATIGNITLGSSPDGLISDFKILNTSVSDSEVIQLYNQGLANHTNGVEDDNKYKTTGDYETDVLDLGNAGQWGLSPNLLTTETLNGNTIGYQTRTSEDGLVWSDYAAVTGTTPNYSIVSPAERYLQLKANFASSGQSSTPSLSGIQVNYVQDADPPDVNASVTVMKRTIATDVITEDTFTNSQSPHFSWSEGSDLAGGSGLRGYCLYLGDDILGNPENDKGILGSSPGSTANTTCPFVVTTPNIDFANTNLRGNTWLQSSTDPYYFVIRAVDNTGNVFQGAPEVFSFYFDNTPPTNPSGLFAPASYQRSFDSFIISWPADGANAAQDAHSEVKGYQYKLGSSGTWYGGSHTGLQDCNDVLTTTSYTLDEDHDTLPSGETPFYFRTVDNACNTSASSISAILKYNSTAPSAPQDLEVTPTTNDENEFGFSWAAPSIFSGSVNNLSYCYTVNTLPSSGTCIFTSSTSLNPDAFATQPGENTFYVVSRDEASNINYGDHASIKFYANTSAPGVPRNLDVADISVKTTKNWRLTVSWDEPEDLGAGVAKYFVYRSFAEDANCSEDFGEFGKIGETAGGSYVDTNLQQKDHYYCVRACDSTNNCSAVSSTSSNFPDGKFTSPAILESAPVVSSVSTRSAKISWITDRDSDSRISYGLASNDYFKEEVGNSEQRIDHELILTNLEPGTQYYFQSKWTDEDGNLGLSDEYTFKTAPPPSVKDVVVSSVGINTAVISFTTTGSTTANLYYGTSTAFGSSKEVATSPLESRYTALLDGLSEGTKYFFQLETLDAEEYRYPGDIYSFNTLPQPKLSNVRIQQVKNAAQPTILVSWESNTEVTSVVSLNPEGKTDALREEVNLELLSGEHQMIIRGLFPNTVYELMVKGSDKLGNQATSTAQRLTTATDTRPATISNLQTETGKGTVTDSAQLIVTWETDEPTTSQVEFGEGTGTTYGQKSQMDSNLTLNHTVVISGLTPGKVYHLRAIAIDEAKNTTESLDYVAITPKAVNSAIELVMSSLSAVFSFLR